MASTALASGSVFDTLNVAFDEILVRLMKWRLLMSSEQWTTLINEFQRGKAHAYHILTLKLNHWQTLPWYLSITWSAGATNASKKAMDRCAKRLSYHQRRPLAALQ